MALLLLLALLGLVLEHSDLLSLAVLYDLSLDSCALNQGSTDLGVLTVQDSQDLLELYLSFSFHVQLLDVQNIALGHGVLLATGNDNCFHFHFTYFIFVDSLLLGAVRFGRTNLSPFDAAGLF